MNDKLSRRNFMRITTAAGGALIVKPLASPLLMAADASQPLRRPMAKIHTVYVGGGGSAWPKPEIDLKKEIAMFETHLAQVERQLGDIQFVGRDHVTSEAEVTAVAAKLRKADGVLLIHLSLGAPLKPVVDAGRPTVVFAQPFSGHEWMYVPQWQKAGKRVALFATSDYRELDRAVSLLRVPAQMRQSRIILVGHAAGTAAACSASTLKERLGVEVVPLSVSQVVRAHQAISHAAAETEAEQWWLSKAKKIVEPSRAEIIKSAQMYLAMKHLMTLLHRVVFYGDHQQSMQDLAALMGLKVIQEA